jgi:hypothetical protein
MKHPRLIITALAVAAFGSWTVQAMACDHGAKATAASGKSACTAAMAAGCTPEMAAACKAKSTGATSAAMAAGCTAEMAAACQAKSATAASAAGCCAPGAKAATATSASKAAGGCPYHDSNASAVTVSAVTAGATGASGGCSMHGSAAKASGAHPEGVTGCSGLGMASAADKSAHADCDACTDMAFCDGEVRAIGAVIQVVPIKNGVMYVYTAEGASKVQALQAAMARRVDRMGRTMGAGEKVHLCAECRSIRGAVASGKLTRELVNIESGCLTLVTSSDRTMVAKIYAMAGIKGPLAAKS